MQIEAGDVQTGEPTYRNFKNIFEILDVVLDQVTETLVLQKITSSKKIFEIKYFKKYFITG